jgi:alpha-L-fucosidase 2
MISPKLWYSQPARHFNEALPLGNGRLGAMFYGHVEEETIHLNDDTLWSGHRAPEPVAGAAPALAEIRRLLFAGDNVAAQRLIEETMLGPFTQTYLPAGDLVLKVDSSAPAENYQRELDLRSATGRVIYTQGGVPHERETFCSAPHQVFALRLTGVLNFDLSLRSQLRHTCVASGREIQLLGQCPVEALWPPVYGDHQPEETLRYDREGEALALRFAVVLRIVSTDGKIESHQDGLSIGDASEATVLLAIATSFSHPDPLAACQSSLDQASSLSYAELKSAHQKDHKRLFDRVELTLGSAPSPDLPTDERLRQYRNGIDPELETLLFHYGRYLLIASSRPGTQPANLQGIWNADLQPPWWSNWTLNINAEMNYWPAEICHLEECHEPLLALTADLAEKGRQTARVLYGCDGWVAHHQTDLWRLTTPVGKVDGRVNEGAALYAMWPMSGAWLCRHLWDHYLFGGDESFLRERAWPVMRGAAEFLLDWLVVNADGKLVTAPSTSPENCFLLPNGTSCAVGIHSAMDRSLIRDLFNNVLSAEKILHRDGAFCRRVETALGRIAPLQIGRQGQIMEWDKDWNEVDPHHRHLSHLYGLHPGSEITTSTTAMADAARRTLELRGDEGTGWSLAWKINLQARLGEGERAYALLRRMLSVVEVETTDVVYANARGGVYPNLLCAHPPFQIDGNFGATSGIAEMLVQSRREDDRWTIDLLPALPSAWPTGKFSGLRARGGFEIAAEWKNGHLQRATILATRGGTLRVRLGTTCTDYETAPGQQLEIKN